MINNMLSKNIFAFVFLVAISFLSASFASDLPLKVYAAYDSSKVGEAAMVNAVVNEIKTSRPYAQIMDMPNASLNNLDLAEQSTIVTAGQFGIDLIKSGSIPAHVKVLLCTHQWFDVMSDLHNIYITMPEHAIDEAIKSIAVTNHLTIIPTLGVLHTMHKETLDAEDTSVIHLRDAKVGVILGGDAEMPDGSWKVFSIENARNLAEEVAEFQKVTGCALLITNGPRTGKSPTAHRNGELDLVSSAFLTVLQAKGLKKGEAFEFFDFQFGQQPNQKPSSALKAIIKVILDNKGFMIVPGESTTSISEMLAIMPAAIYKNDAMNATHERYVDQLVQSNIVASWPEATDQALMRYTPPPRQEIAVVSALLSS